MRWSLTCSSFSPTQLSGLSVKEVHAPPTLFQSKPSLGRPTARLAQLLTPLQSSRRARRAESAPVSQTLLQSMLAWRCHRRWRGAFTTPTDQELAIAVKPVACVSECSHLRARDCSDSCRGAALLSPPRNARETVDLGACFAFNRLGGSSRSLLRYRAATGLQMLRGRRSWRSERVR